MTFCPRLVSDVPTLSVLLLPHIMWLESSSIHFILKWIWKNELKLTFLCKIKAECAKQGYKEIIDFSACSAVFIVPFYFERTQKKITTNECRYHNV